MAGSSTTTLSIRRGGFRGAAFREPVFTMTRLLVTAISVTLRFQQTDAKEDCSNEEANESSQ